MRMVRYYWWLCLLTLAAGGAEAANTQARLLLNVETARPGQTILAGVNLRMATNWHTYWRNGGDSGKGTEIRWTLPEGVTAGEIQWPVPEKYSLDDQTTYIYERDAVLLVPLKLASSLPNGELLLEANVSWLECEMLCIPGKASLEAKVAVAPVEKASAAAPLIEAAQKRLPRLHPKAATAKAWWDQKPVNDSRPLVIEWTTAGSPETVDFFPYENDRLEVSGVTKVLNAGPGIARLRKTVKKLEGDWPAEMPGLLIEQTRGEDAVGYEVRIPIGAKGADQPMTGTVKPAGSFLGMLGLAFLGGLILNIMPCVLPVISLKILSFVKQSRDAPSRVRTLGLIYVLGVLVSFLVMAGLVIGVQQAGRAASWGMQFQNTSFLIAMTVLVTLVALNLFGVFEVSLGGKVMGVAGSLTSQGGAPGAFFNGVLATALATPCTAPFLAPALGFAFAQTPAVILLMFLMIALGLSFPYILLSFQPAWLRFLPKPGPWMERFKVIMGFPMLGTAVWLYTIASLHLGKSGTFWFGIFLVTLGLAAWVWGEFVQRSLTRPALPMAVTAVMVAAVGFYALRAGAAHEGIPWQQWSPGAVAEARAAGRPVLVDFTADWCATCQFNKRTSLEIAPVQAKLKEINAAAFLGDYTREDPAITEELRRFNRAGVPLVLVYPKDPAAPPQVLPELLTPGIVLEALDRAAKQ